MAVYSSSDPVAQEFVMLHRKIQDKVAVLTKEIEKMPS